MNSKVLTVVSLSLAVIALAVAVAVRSMKGAERARLLAERAASEEEIATRESRKAEAEAKTAEAKAKSETAAAEKAKADAARAVEEAKAKKSSEEEAAKDAEAAEAEAVAAKARAKEASEKAAEAKALAAKAASEAAKAESEKAKAKAVADAAAAKAEAEKAKLAAFAAEAKALELRKIDFETAERQLLEFRQELDEREKALRPEKTAADLVWVAEREPDVIGETGTVKRVKAAKVAPEDDRTLPRPTRRLAKSERLVAEQMAELQASSSNSVVRALERLYVRAVEEERLIDADFYARTIRTLYPQWVYRLVERGATGKSQTLNPKP